MTFRAVAELENTKDCNQAGKPLFCPSHPTEELRLFCEQCDQLVCQNCITYRHQQHPYDFTGNVIHRHGDALREMLKNTQEHMDTLKDVLSQIDDMGSAIHSRAGAVATEICLFASGYVKAIEEHRDQLLKQLLPEVVFLAGGLWDACWTRRPRALKQLEALKVQKANLLHLQKARLQQLLLDMRTGVEFTEHLLTSGSDLEILITKGGVASQLAKLITALLITPQRGQWDPVLSQEEGRAVLWL